MIETVPSGTVLHGRYRIERVLGSGGFGHVYLALDLSTNQLYALKEYLISGPSGQEQLMHEANVLSQLHHPNLPAFHDAFSERGRYYVIISYIEGEDLTDIIRKTQRRNEVVPLQQLIGWMLETCDAVLFLHNQHPPVIHRDIKPDNIRIMRNGTAILVDLGNAKAYADGLRTLLFIRHQGTPGYAPPEQYPGGSGTDTRSDVYALGATLYFAITGHEPPSVSTRNQAIQQGQRDLPTLQEVLAQNPPENSQEANAAKQFRLGVSKPTKPAPRHSRHVAQLAALSPSAIGLLNALLQRSMAMRPKDRYQFVADFARDLKHALDVIVSETKPAAHPYSTQPDLPRLYEDMQNAKYADAIDSQQIAQTPRSTYSIPSHCPDCNATLMANAPFCPNCGLVFTTTPHNTSHPPMPASTAPSDIGMVKQDHGTSAQQDHIGAADAVVAAPAQSPQTPRAYMPISHQQDSTGNAASPSPSSPGDTVPTVPHETKSAQTSLPTTSPRQVVPQKSPGFTISTGLIVAVLIILIVLIIIMLVLIVNHVQPAALQASYFLQLDTTYLRT